MKQTDGRPYGDCMHNDVGILEWCKKRCRYFLFSHHNYANVWTAKSNDGTSFKKYFRQSKKYSFFTSTRITRFSFSWKQSQLNPSTTARPLRLCAFFFFLQPNFAIHDRPRKRHPSLAINRVMDDGDRKLRRPNRLRCVKPAVTANGYFFCFFRGCLFLFGFLSTSTPDGNRSGTFRNGLDDRRPVTFFRRPPKSIFPPTKRLGSSVGEGGLKRRHDRLARVSNTVGGRNDLSTRSYFDIWCPRVKSNCHST